MRITPERGTAVRKHDDKMSSKLLAHANNESSRPFGRFVGNSASKNRRPILEGYHFLVKSPRQKQSPLQMSNAKKGSCVEVDTLVFEDRANICKHPTQRICPSQKRLNGGTRQRKGKEMNFITLWNLTIRVQRRLIYGFECKLYRK